MKGIVWTLAALLLSAGAAQAQEVLPDSVAGPTEGYTVATDSLAQPVADSVEVAPKAEAEMPSADYELLQQRIWKDRAKYFNFVYGTQKLKSDYLSMSSDMAFALMSGKTYYLHKKPILGMIKFGLDWTFFDINFAKYPDLEEPAPSSSYYDDEEDLDLGFMQLEVGMGIGPSVTVNPIDHLKAALYFHVTPSYSMILQDDEFYQHYATFFNLGFTVAYKVISLGIEHRWCGKTDYGGVMMDVMDEIYDEEGNFHDPFESVGRKLSTKTFRVFLAFRF